MLETKPNPSITPTRYRDSLTGIDSEAPITRYRGEAARAAWQQFIDQTLTSWLRDPGILEDDGVEPPSGTIIRLSMDLAERYRDLGLPAPDSIAPDANGGIVFERREGTVIESLHVWEDFTVEYLRFDGHRLIERSPVFGA